ncbi:hypothetical protein K523DRAFT_367186 [Schizophyllum commune Tattone D]|nr:hypothetical protein K523DRAFT_367186 [Schizophyllum commune Tattone D]
MAQEHWATHLKANSQVAFTPECDLRITNVCLGQDLHKEVQKQRIAFAIAYGEQKMAYNVAVLTPITPHAVIDLMLTRNRAYTLHCKGNLSLDLVGYHLPGASVYKPMSHVKLTLGADFPLAEEGPAPERSRRSITPTPSNHVPQAKKRKTTPSSAAARPRLSPSGSSTPRSSSFMKALKSESSRTTTASSGRPETSTTDESSQADAEADTETGQSRADAEADAETGQPGGSAVPPEDRDLLWEVVNAGQDSTRATSGSAVKAFCSIIVDERVVKPKSKIDFIIGDGTFVVQGIDEALEGVTPGQVRRIFLSPGLAKQTDSLRNVVGDDSSIVIELSVLWVGLRP